MKGIGNDLIKYMYDNKNAMAESHIESWRDRYFRYSKDDIEHDLCGHDFSSEQECIEHALGRKLSSVEYVYAEQEFNDEVLSVF